MFKNKITLILIIAFFFSWLNTQSYIDFQLNMSLGEGYVYVAKSLALDKNFEISEYWTNAGVDVIAVGDEKYIAYTPLPSILMAIPYFLLQILYYFYTNYIGIINGDFSIVLESLAFGLSSTLAYVGIGYFLAKILQYYKLSQEKIIWLLISILFGTIILNYSVTYLNHVFSAFFALGVFYSLFIKKYNQNTSYFIAGIYTSLVFLAEHTLILISISVLLVLIKKLIETKNLRQVVINGIYYSVPVITGIILIGIYNYYLFGSPFTFAEHMMFLQNIERGIPTVSFSQNPFFGLFGFYLSPYKGVFLTSPALILGFFGIKKYFKQYSTHAIFVISFIVIISVLYAFWSDCFGATTFGARYMTSLLPFWIILTAFSFEKKNIFNLFKILSIYAVLICTINMFDGMPSGRWFGGCGPDRIYNYAPFLKAKDYLENQRPITSVIYRYLSKHL